jgi:hypothetical protein
VPTNSTKRMTRDEELRRLTAQNEELRARMADALRRLESLATDAAPDEKLAAGPARRSSKSSWPRKIKRNRSPGDPLPANAIFIFPTTPRPIGFRDGKMICEVDRKTVQVPIVSCPLQLDSGLVAHVQRLGSSRFRGLALHAVVEIPRNKRGRRLNNS